MSPTRIRVQPRQPLFTAGSGVSRAFGTLVLLAVAIGTLRRLSFGFDTPMWLDEAFTGAIAIEPDFRVMIQQSLRDVAAPVYYCLMWLWEKVFGASSLSLRIPSLLFAIATPLLIFWSGHPDRLTRQLWAALAALWVPAFFHASDARAYTLLFLLASVQIMLFMRMVARPTIRSAALWSGLSAVFVLTHYHAGLVTALQGLAYLFLNRKDAWRTWPAALLFLPVLAWMSLHLPLLLEFSRPEKAWQKLLGPADALLLPKYLVGYPLRLSWAVLLALGLGCGWEAFQRLRGRAGSPVSRAEVAVVATSALAILVVIGVGFLRPNFVPRYLLPFMPGVLFGAAIWTRVLASRFLLLPWLIVVLLILGTAGDTFLRARTSDWRVNMSWEAASRDLSEAGARRVIFAWDNPSAALIAPELMEKVGSFFFDRMGKPIPVVTLILAGKGDIDPNRAFLAAANRPGDGVVWLADAQVPGTRAARYPPALSRLDPALQCRKYGYGVFACIRIPNRVAETPLT